jgi:hypothetical protein
VKVLLIDSNLLLLLLVGAVAPHLVGNHRRLSQFDLDDLQTVAQTAQAFERHITFPNILTEVSNFIGSGRQKIASGASEAFVNYVDFVDEIYEPSDGLVRKDVFPRLGLTDTAITTLQRMPVTVLTVDHQLYGLLASRGVTAINLFHAKTPN